MNGSYKRTDRVSDVIKKEVADVLFREAKDPRLQFITITHVRVSRDLKNAKIFFTSMKEGQELEAIQAGLKSASGFVQRQLGARLHLRYTPHITFVFDRSLENGCRMDKILKEIEDGKTTHEE